MVRPPIITFLRPSASDSGRGLGGEQLVQGDLVAAELLTDAGGGREDGVDRERADHRQRGEGQGEAGSGAGLPRLRYMRGGEGGGHRRKPKLVNPPAAPSSALREAISRRCAGRAA